jgi:hypothetical protein
MGSWGTGIKQSDAFLDVYDTFFDRYNNGENPADISKQITKDLSEILENEEEKHEFWFALALAQWETKCLDRNVLETVESIISTNADLKLWKNIGAPESDLKKRKITLDNFLIQINSDRPKQKPRKKTKFYPPIYKDGDCIVFKLKNENYGGAVILKYDSHPKIGHRLLTAMTRLNQKEKPTIDNFKNSEILICNFNGMNFHNHAEIKDHVIGFGKETSGLNELIGNLEVEFEYDNSNSGGKGYLFAPNTSTSGDVFAFIADRQFEYERTSPRPEKKLTLRQLIKNGL